MTITPRRAGRGPKWLRKSLADVYSDIRHAKTIRVSEEYHEWLSAHNEDGETMEETLRRMTRGPHPSDVAGLLTEAEAEDPEEAVNRLPGRGRDRFGDARDALSGGGAEE